MDKLISEQGLKDWLNKWEGYIDADIIARMQYRVCDIPSAKPKTGHWIFDEILDRNYYCSECKSMGVDYWDYCPYCGARMVEPQESEETDG